MLSASLVSPYTQCPTIKISSTNWILGHYKVNLVKSHLMTQRFNLCIVYYTMQP